MCSIMQPQHAPHIRNHCAINRPHTASSCLPHIEQTSQNKCTGTRCSFLQWRPAQIGLRSCGHSLSSTQSAHASMHMPESIKPRAPSSTAQALDNSPAPAPAHYLYSPSSCIYDDRIISALPVPRPQVRSINVVFAWPHMYKRCALLTVLVLPLCCISASRCSMREMPCWRAFIAPSLRAACCN